MEDKDGSDDGKEMTRSLEIISKRLEETVRSDYESSHVISGNGSVSAQIRDVVSKHLSTEDLSQVGNYKYSLQSYKDENSSLKDELDRIENLLALSRAEKDEVLIRYNALSERFDQLQRQSFDGLEEATVKSLLSQNLELRHRFEEDRKHYQKKFSAYQDGQRQQAELVQKLHSKVVQYRQKCDNLELAINRDAKRFLDEPDAAANIYTTHDLLTDDNEIALIKLDEEQKRCSNLVQVNSLLREQLEAATEANRSLATEVQTLAFDWQRTKEELDTKENDWKDEEKSFNSYFLDEHNKLLSLWRDASRFRREYKDMKVSTERDLSKIQNELKSLSGELKNACVKIRSATPTFEPNRTGHDGGDVSFDQPSAINPTELWRRIQELTKSHADIFLQRNDFENRLDEMNTLNTQLNLNLSAKEKLIASLKREIDEQDFLKETEAKQQKALSECRDENRQFSSAFKDIVSQINRAFKDDPEISFNHTSGSSNRVITSTATAIKSCIQNYLLKLEELKNKLSANQDLLRAAKDQNKEGAENTKQLENENRQLKLQIESIEKEKTDFGREIERFKVKFENLNDEKEREERAKKLQIDLNAELHFDIENLQRENSTLMKNSDNLLEENESTKEISEKQKTELDSSLKKVSKLESQIEALKNELMATNEDLSKVSSSKNAAAQEISELVNTLKKTETRCRFLEIDCFKLKTAETDIKSSLSKIHDESDALFTEKSELMSQLKKLTEEKIALATEVRELELEKITIKEEMLKLEQEKLELIESQESLKDLLSDAERANALLQNESDVHIREKREIESALAAETRKRMALSEDIDNLQRELQQKSMMIDTSFNEKERLIKAGTDSEFHLANAEREIDSLKSVIKSMKHEKNKMEASSFKSQQSSAALKSQINQMKAENEDLEKKKQLLQARIDDMQSEIDQERSQKDNIRKLLEDKLIIIEQEFSHKLETAESRHKEDRKRLLRENESLKINLENAHQEDLQKCVADKDQQLFKYEAKLEAIQKQLTATQQQLQDVESEADQSKQHSDAQSRKEMSNFKDQIHLLEKDIQNLRHSSEKEKRDWSLQNEKDRNAIADLKNQLSITKTQAGDANLSHEKELKDLRNLIKELDQQKSQALQELISLRSKLKIMEESNATFKKDISELSLKLKEGDNKNDSFLQELFELKQLLNMEKQEKIANQKIQESISNQLRQSRISISELKQSLQDSKQKITVMESSNLSSLNQADKMQKRIQELEKMKLEMRKDIQSLNIKLQSVESDLIIKKQELNDLQIRLAHEESKDESNKRDIFGYKQKINDLETIRDVLTKDLIKVQRQLSEERDIRIIHERDFKNTIEETQRKAKLQEDKRNHVEKLLADTNINLESLMGKLNNAEARARILLEETFKTEESKRSLENKLTNICSALRKYVGLPSEASGFSKHFKKRHTSSKSIGESPRHNVKQDNGELEVDVELVRSTLQHTMEKSISLENEKEDAFVQLKHAKENIEDLEKERKTIQEKFVQAQNALSSNQKSTQNFSMQISTAEKTIVTHLESIERLKNEVQSCNSVNRDCKDHIQKLELENGQLASQLKKLQHAETKLEQDYSNLKEDLNKTENQVSVALQSKRSAETELQRQKMILTDKETENQILKERCENLVKQINDLEEKVMSSQITMERLNMTLERSVEDESELKNKLQTLNKSLTESNSSGWSLQEKIQQLQKALANSETDRRLLQEKNENFKSSCQESKKSNLALGERVQQLRIELRNYEEKIRNSESDSRNFQKLIDQHKESENENLQLIQKLQLEKHALQDVIAELQRALTQIEVEKQDFQRWHILLEKDKSALKQTLDKVERDRLMSSEKMNRTVRERAVVDRSVSSLENDNSELRNRKLKLEEQISDMEKLHAQQMLNITSRQRHEKDMEIDRIRNAQVQAEKTLELRERSHRQRVLGLEQQIQLLKDQLNQEIRKRQLYIQRSTQAADDMKGLRNVLDQSLRSVSRDTTLDSALLQSEAKKLDYAVDQHLTSHLSPSAISRTADQFRSSLTSSTPLRRKLP